MAIMKRVNMDIDSVLWKAVKKSAIDQDIELREWVAQALKEKLDVADVREAKAIPKRV